MKHAKLEENKEHIEVLKEWYGEKHFKSARLVYGDGYLSLYFVRMKSEEEVNYKIKLVRLFGEGKNVGISIDFAEIESVDNYAKLMQQLSYCVKELT
jgi:hypothetical protein